MSTLKRCCNCNNVTKGPLVSYHNKPCKKTWSLSDGEVTLFNVWVKLTGNKQLLVDANIAAEISPSAPEVYNMYKLYVDDKPVAQAGYEADDEAAGPNLETSSINWGKNFNAPANCCEPHCSCPCVKVKLTAQIKGPAGGPNFASNVNNQSGNFKGAKVASLRTLSL